MSRSQALISLRRLGFVASAFVALAGSCSLVAAQPDAGQLQELLEQNRRLQEQVRAQQATIEALSATVGTVMRASERHEAELRGLQDRTETSAARSAEPSRERGGREVRINAESGFTYFKTGRAGQFPNGEFRADDPTISVEAPVVRDVYFYSELKLLPRETNEERFELGEIYADFENVSGRWGHDGLLNVRIGRINIPFGEEYLARSPVVNPLISHSLSDFWGCDEGVEIYGRIGPIHYVMAVQNGGSSQLRDFHSDKAVVARLGWQPLSWLHVSGSAMRTGKLAAVADNLSEMWFGDGFFRSIGASATTTTFWADIFQLDATTRWRGGHARASAGEAIYGDDDTSRDNSRRMRFGYVEAKQDIIGDLFAAARFSEIRAPRGYPLAGWGARGTFFFKPGTLTEELRRLSVGLGYRFGPPLVLKVEYTWESGRMVTGARRDDENFFGTQLGVKF